MTKRVGKRVVVWLPEELLGRIDGQREWRTTSEYIRNTLDKYVGKPKLDARPAVKSQALVDHVEAEPEPPSIDLIRRAYDALYSEEGAWAKYSARYDSITDAVNEVLKNTFFNRKLDEMIEKKNPAEAG